MKRFVLDACFIFMIVSLGRNYIEDPAFETIDEKLERFNQQVENHEILDTVNSTRPLNTIEENWAGKLGEHLSHAIISVIDGSVRFITTVFSEN